MKQESGGGAIWIRIRPIQKCRQTGCEDEKADVDPPIPHELVPNLCLTRVSAYAAATAATATATVAAISAATTTATAAAARLARVAFAFGAALLSLRPGLETCVSFPVRLFKNARIFWIHHHRRQIGEAARRCVFSV